MARGARLICAIDELAERGRGVRFEVELRGEHIPAFAVRVDGRAYAYLNRCRHMPMELDWRLGEFFDAERRHLICSTHGATYAADGGACLGGPCGDAPLQRLAVEERDGGVYYLEPEDGRE